MASPLNLGIALMSKMPDRSVRRKQRLEVVYRTIDEIKPNLANARRHSGKQIRKLADSIETFGFNVPVLVDAELNAVAGHARLAACRLLGLAELPTLCLDHLSPAQLRAFARR
jgi:ParB-like chromosome segregation protein Spo0J